MGLIFSGCSTDTDYWLYLAPEKKLGSFDRGRLALQCCRRILCGRDLKRFSAKLKGWEGEAFFFFLSRFLWERVQRTWTTSWDARALNKTTCSTKLNVFSLIFRQIIIICSNNYLRVNLSTISKLEIILYNYFFLLLVKSLINMSW